MCARMDDAERTLGFRVVDLNYVSLYLEDLDAGVEFYSELFGPPFSGEGFYFLEASFLISSASCSRAFLRYWV